MSKPPSYDYETLKDLKLDQTIRALIFSAPKAGKTEFLLTFPNAAVLDYDGKGVKVAKNKGFIARHGNVDDNIRFKTFSDPIDPVTGIFKDATAFLDSIKWLNAVLEDPWVKTVGIDSVTSLAVAASNAGLKAGSSRGRSKSLEHGRKDGVLLLGKQDFGAEMQALSQLFDQLMTVPDKHIIVTAHVRTEVSESGMTIAREPLLTGGKLRAQVAKWFDDVWFLDVKPNGQRVLICQPKGNLIGVGSRLGLPAEIPDPTYDKIVQLLT